MRKSNLPPEKKQKEIERIFQQIKIDSSKMEREAGKLAVGSKERQHLISAQGKLTNYIGLVPPFYEKSPVISGEQFDWMQVSVIPGKTTGFGRVWKEWDRQAGYDDAMSDVYLSASSYGGRGGSITSGKGLTSPKVSVLNKGNSSPKAISVHSGNKDYSKGNKNLGKNGNKFNESLNQNVSAKPAGTISNTASVNKPMNGQLPGVSKKTSGSSGLVSQGNHEWKQGTLAGENYKKIVNKVPGVVLGKYDATTGPGPIKDLDKRKSFSGGRYSTIKLTEDIVAYRAWTPHQSNEFGAYWALEKPRGSLQTTIDSAIIPEWGFLPNKVHIAQANQYTKIVIPAGTIINIGEVGSQSHRGPFVGAKTQLLIEGGAKPEWVVGRGKLQ